jgi:hypothetical protein
MVTHAITKYKIPKFWDDEFKSLPYVNESFNDDENLKLWTKLGFANKFTGDMCDMRSVQPRWNPQFVNIFEQLGWQDVGTSYYRMMPGTILPTHSDLYKRYIDIFKLQGQEQTIRRTVVFLEDWKPGHYAEYNDQPFVGWTAGWANEWSYDAPHMAANMGSEPRYTLQVTGHV